MTNDETKLRRDVDILEAMSTEMDSYLRHEVMFWPMTQGDMPRLTLGGFFLRAHRLIALSALLTPDERSRVSLAMAQFNELAKNHVVAIEKRLYEEIEVRLRQWQTSLRDWQAQAPTPSLYATGVEVRAMIASMLNKLDTPPFRQDAQLLARVHHLDRALQKHWQSGEFVWPAAWQPAYPQEEYSWLYGLPNKG
jgi:hypothetical protein